MASWLSGFSTSTVIQGLSGVPLENQPPANIVHWAWDGMVFGGTGLALLAAWYLLYWIIRRRLPVTKWFYRCAAVAGILSVFCIECGWVVTEVGRQPWIIYNILRTADAVTLAGIVRPLEAIVVIIYALIAIATVLTLRAMSRRWAEGETQVPSGPYAPIGVPPVDGRAARWCGASGQQEGRRRMNVADLVAAVLLLAVTAYAVLGGADFGAGFWDLVAGGTREGARPRALINSAIGPVWRSTTSG